MTVATNRRILCVDDEPRVLEGLERTLFEHFDVTTECSSVKAVGVLERGPVFAVVLSDMRMPEMDGAAFLMRARQIAPFTSRMLLTGQADVGSAIAAINHGHILRFLCKPCAGEVLVAALEAGVEQHRLVNAERELLERTVTGCVRLLTEILSIVAPNWFSRAHRIKALVAHMSSVLQLEAAWRYELAALFSLIGCVGLPEATLERVLNDRPLDAGEQKAFDEHPMMAHRLLAEIPRFDEIAEMIKLQNGKPRPVTNDVERGGAMLRIAFQIDRSVDSGKSIADSLSEVGPRLHASELPLLRALADFRGAAGATMVRALTVSQMTVRMRLEQDVKTVNGVVVVPKGRELSSVLIERLLNFSRAGTIAEPIRVRTPA